MTVHANNLELNEIVSIIISYRWTIAGYMVAALLVGSIYFVMATPEYRVDALLKVDDNDKTVKVFADTSEVGDGGIMISDKVEILKSRSVLDEVIEEMKLDTVITPVYLPVIGEALSRRVHLDIGDYASGDEVINIDSFTVPDSFLNREFTLVATGGGGFNLIDWNGIQIGSGMAGAMFDVMRNDSESIRLSITELRASPGKSFKIVKKQRLKAIKDLKERMNVKESKGDRGYGPSAGIINIALTGSDPVKTAKTLNSIVDAFLKRNTQQKSTNTRNLLSYLEKQLSDVTKQLERAESSLNYYRLQKGSIDLSKETETVLSSTVDVESKLSALKRERDDLLQLFTKNNPRIVAVDSKISGLNSELNSLNQKIRAMPQVQQEVLRLTRNAELSRSLYNLLIKKTQELRIVVNGLVDDISVIDYAAVPTMPESPKAGLVMALSIVLGGLLGVARLVADRAINGGIDDPEIIENQLGLNVFAVVPTSDNQKKINNAVISSSADKVLAAAVSDDFAIESLRNLRTVLDFKSRDLRNNILLVTGPSPGVGKSFVAANLGVLWANANKKVLLIDADFRRGNVHHYFGAERNLGLSNSIDQHIPLNDSIFKTKTENLFVMPAGKCPDKPSDLFLKTRLDEILKEFSTKFDHVIIDAPPVLGLSDAPVLAQKAGFTLLVIRDGKTTLRETRQAVKSLKQSGVTPDGVVFNNMQVSRSKYGYGRYYGYAYK